MSAVKRLYLHQPNKRLPFPPPDYFLIYVFDIVIPLRYTFYGNQLIVSQSTTSAIVHKHLVRMRKGLKTGRKL
mgnify:CR=1 FL=1